MILPGNRPPLPALGEILEFMRLVWEIDHGLQRTSKRMARVLGVTGPQRLVLRIVGRFPGIPANQLARLMHVHPSTLSGILKRLERQGYVRRRPDARDRRRLLLGLTEKGRQLDVEAPGTVEAAVQHVFAKFSDGDLHAARDVLAALAARFASSDSEPASPPRTRGKGARQRRA